MGINDGLILVDGQISFDWMVINFWRAFIVTTINYVSILAIIQLSRVLGFFSNVEIERKMEDILLRPQDDNVDIFSQIKQPIYQKHLAYNRYHKRRIEGGALC